MPFTGTGTGIQNASDVFFSAPAQDHVLSYNGSTSKWNNTLLKTALSGNAALADGGGKETVYTANATGAATVNLGNGNVFNYTLTGNVTGWTFSGATAGKACSFTLYITQGGTVRTVAWTLSGATLKWAGGSVPSVTATANATDIFVFETINGGTTWYGSLVGNNFS